MKDFNHIDIPPQKGAGEMIAPVQVMVREWRGQSSEPPAVALLVLRAPQAEPQEPQSQRGHPGFQTLVLFLRCLSPQLPKYP